MPINKKSHRRMSPLARRVAELHNDAANLARRLKQLSEDVAPFEAGISRKDLNDFDFSRQDLEGSSDIKTIRLRQRNFKAPLGQGKN
jgi:hypothetical protein